MGELFQNRSPCTQREVDLKLRARLLIIRINNKFQGCKKQWYIPSALLKTTGKQQERTHLKARN